MRKLALLFISGLACFALTNCCNCGKNGGNGQCPNAQVCEDGPRGPQGHHGEGRPDEEGPKGPKFEEMSEECKAKFEKWAKFDSLSENEQKALLAERKAQIDSMEAQMKKNKEELEAKWANFSNLSIAEQKQLIDMKSCPMMGGHKGGPKHGECGPKGGNCPMDGHKPCPNAPKEK